MARLTKQQLLASERKARTRNIRAIKGSILLIVLVMAFFGGFVLRGQSALLESLGFGGYGTDIDRNPGMTVSGDTYDSIGARVEEVEGIISQESLDSYDLSEATSDVIGALSDAANDSSLTYFNEKRLSELQEQNADSEASVGVLFSENEGRAYAVDVFEDSEAQIAGVQQGDVVVAINGERGHDWSAAEVMAALSNTNDESVVITWLRNNASSRRNGEEFVTTLKTNSKSVENVVARRVKKVGVVTLRQITYNSAELVSDAVKTLQQKGAESFVLDLRNNPGGFLTQSVDIASLFIKSGTIVKVKSKNSEDASKVASGEVVTDKPLVVLVNDNTAAAAEVLVAALRDNKRAQVVGTKTFGKGSVQVTTELSFGGALRYTAAYYKTPLDHDIEGVGITPDVEINRSKSDDNQLRIAVETAESLSEE